ncbi:MAG: roadblock/LC7 domain-containing protein [Deltaproteobacteria bacterium]|nr:roadblock/LC7 domain-containing protein [Deltaproteobacteria bacterium]
MGFREHIERLVREVPGSVNCTLLGFDGIAIDSVDGNKPAGQLNAGDATIEFAHLVAQIRRAAEGLAAGDVDEVCIRSDKMVALLRPLTAEYLVVLTMLPGGLVGKGRHLLRVAAPKLQQELS